MKRLLYLCVMPGFMVLPQQGTVLIFVACVTTEGHSDICGLCCHLIPCWCLWAMLLLGTMLKWVISTATWGHVDVHGLLPGTILVSWIPLAPETLLMPLVCMPPRVMMIMMVSVACTVAEIPLDVCGLFCQQRPCWGLWHVLTQETMRKSMICASTDCKGQESSFGSGLNDCRPTVEKDWCRFGNSLYNPRLPINSLDRSH